MPTTADKKLLVYVDPEHELVVVIRWIADMKSMDATVKKIIEAINR
jgi:hypothetical protein